MGGWSLVGFERIAKGTALALALACAPALNGKETAVDRPVLDTALLTARTYLEAMATADGAAVYELLAPERREGTSADGCKRVLEQAPPEARTLAITGAPELQIAYGGVAPLVFAVHEGSIRLIGGVPRFDRRDTPERALETFARAVRARDDSLLAAFIPASQRGAVGTGQLKSRLADPTFVGETLAAIAALEQRGRPEVLGPDLWRIRAEAHEAVFQRESGEWVLANLE